jgi:hypothetical protein
MNSQTKAIHITRETTKMTLQRTTFLMLEVYQTLFRGTMRRLVSPCPFCPEALLLPVAVHSKLLSFQC